MSRRQATWLAWGLWTLTAALAVVQLALLPLLNHRKPGDPTVAFSSSLVAFFAFQCFATVGAVVASRRRENPIGWLFCAAALLCQVGNFGEEYAVLAHERSLPAGIAADVALPPLWLVGIGLGTIVSFLFFPDGHLPSPRWRPAAWAAGGWLVVGYALQTVTPGDLPGLEGVRNPIGISGAGPVGTAVIVLALPLMIVAVASLVVRYRRSAGIEKDQMRLFVVATVTAAILIGCFSLLSGLTGLGVGNTVVGDVVWLLLLALVPISMGVAILRYRLYEIDRVVSRALVYAGITAVLGLAYVGLVLAGQALFSSFAGGSNLAIAASTLVVAALFLPVRSRVQRFVDRRFYRSHYDAQRTLEAFGARLREQVELDALATDLRGVVGETMKPEHVGVWLRERRA